MLVNQGSAPAVVPLPDSLGSGDPWCCSVSRPEVDGDYLGDRGATSLVVACALSFPSSPRWAEIGYRHIEVYRGVTATSRGSQPLRGSSARRGFLARGFGLHGRQGRLRVSAHGDRELV